MRDKNKEVQFEQPSDILLLINQYLVFILAIMVITILAVGYFFLLNPKIQAISAVKQEDTETQQNKLQNEKLLSKIQELEAEFNSIKSDRQEDFDKLKMILPAEPQIAELFVLADTIAEKHGFILSSIDISEDNSSPIAEPKTDAQNAPPIDTNAGDENANSAELAVNKSEFFPLKSLIVHLAISQPAAVLDDEGQPIRDESQANSDVYQNFKDYIVDLQKNLRLMDIITMSFGELTQAGEGSETGFNLDIITYFRNNGQE